MTRRWPTCAAQGCRDDPLRLPGRLRGSLPALLRQFSSQHPQAIVEVVCGPTPRLIEQLDKRAVDLAMISLPDDGANGDIIRREQLVWIGYPGPNPRISIRCRWRCPIATRSITSRPARRWIARAAITRRVCEQQSRGLIALVRSGQAFAVMTQTAVPADLAIVTGDPLPPLPAVGITLKFDRKRPSHLTAAFAEHIRLTLPLL